MSAACRLAVLGDPLAYTRSPELHRAGLAAIGRRCESTAVRTAPEELGGRLEALAAAGYRGVNLTHPLKEAALAHLPRVSDAARRARSVNTVGFEADGPWGETTDGTGFIDLLRSLGRDPERQRAVLLGAGGAGRSLALALIEAGCVRPVVSTRQPAGTVAAWGDTLDVATVVWRSTEEREALAAATLVVNATPLRGGEEPAPIERLDRGALVVDLVYGPELTPWVARARAAGLEACDGLGLLVFQARRSLSLWTGVEVPLEPLARAVGWPR